MCIQMSVSMYQVLYKYFLSWYQVVTRTYIGTVYANYLVDICAYIRSGC